MRIVLVGSVGRFPLAGHAWVNCQYLLGLQELGCDVFYLEDAGEQSWVYDWQRQKLTDDLEYPVGFIQKSLETVGLQDRWMYRAGNRTAGMSSDAMRQVCAGADLLLIRGAPVPVWRDEYDAPKRRAFIDVDPVFTQIKAARGDHELVETIKRCEVLFTIAQRMGRPDCTIPDLGRSWQPTLSPVYLPRWPLVATRGRRRYTTILQWSSYQGVQHAGRRYGNKTHEWPRFLEVERHVDADFCVAMTGRPPASVDTGRWDIVDGISVSDTMSNYQNFIQQSAAEFSVAKHGYVVSRGGWFSDRSVCYLASGKPVVVQDTTFGDVLPVGEGVLTFQTVEQAIEALEDVDRWYDEHCRAARDLAESRFATDCVLPMLLSQAMG
jgi:hypothetical protein